MFKEIKKILKATGKFNKISIDSNKKTIYIDNEEGFYNLSEVFKDIKNFKYMPNNHVYIKDADFIIKSFGYIEGRYHHVWLKQYSQFLKDGR